MNNNNKMMLNNGSTLNISTIKISYDTKANESDMFSSDEKSTEPLITYEYCLLNIKELTDIRFKKMFVTILDGLPLTEPPCKIVTKYKHEFEKDPPFNFEIYLKHIYSQFNSSGIFIPLTGLYYLYKILNIHKNLSINSYNKFRLIWISTIVAYKFLDDQALKMSNGNWYCIIGNDILEHSRITLHKLKIIEMEFLRILDYDLNVKKSDIVEMIEKLVPLEYII